MGLVVSKFCEARRERAFCFARRRTHQQPSIVSRWPVRAGAHLTQPLRSESRAYRRSSRADELLRQEHKAETPLGCPGAGPVSAQPSIL